MSNIINYLGMLCLVLSSNYFIASAQNTVPIETKNISEISSFGLLNNDDNIIFHHHLQLGGSIIQGDIFNDYFVSKIGLMFSAGYQYQITKAIGLATSIYIIESANTASVLYPAGQTSLTDPLYIQIGQYYRLSHSVNGTCNIVWNPFYETPADWSNLAVGIGIAGRSAGLLSIATRIKPDSQAVETRFTRQFALGGHAFLQYVIPLSTEIDLGFRAESQIFLPPISIIGERISLRSPPSSFSYTVPITLQSSNDIAIGALGVGVFLRLKF